MEKILVATEKPFAPKAVENIRDIAAKNGYQLELLEKYTDKNELLKAVSTNATALIIRSDKVDKEVINAGKELKIIVRAGAGYDNVDLQAAKENNVVVMNTPGQNSNAVAELAIGMMVFLARNKFQPKAGTELLGKTLGLHAFGNVGVNIARIAKGFGMEVYAYDPFIPEEVITKEGVKPVGSVEELYSSCQYISLHIPANDKTKKSIDYELMNKIPQNAVLLNTARKEVVCEESLIKIMTERDDFKYIADIAPVNKDELQEKFADRVYFTPKKMGAQTKEANINAGTAAAQQIVGFIENNDTTYKVN